MKEQYLTKISNQDQRRLYLVVFLAAIVITSKKSLIIYNEERCLLIQQELETFFVLKKDSLIQALQQHKNVSSLMKSITTLIKFTKQLLNKASQRCLVVLNNIFFQHIKQKLSTLFLSTTPLELEWNRQLAAYQLPLVLANLENGDH